MKPVRPRAPLKNGVVRAANASNGQNQQNGSLSRVSRVNVGPSPKRFGVDMERRGHLSDVAKCSLGTVLRLGAGALVNGYTFSLEKRQSDEAYAVVKAGPYASVERGRVASATPPAQMLVLFAKMDGPGRKVREALSILDLDCVVYPSTRSWGGVGFDHKLHSVTLRDPNTGVELIDANDIVAYLFETYGTGEGDIPWVMRRDNAIGGVLLRAAVWLRDGSGTRYSGKPSNEDIEPTDIEFWGYEASPFCGVAYEAVSEAGLPHVLRTVARGSSKRDVLFEEQRHFQAPFFVDGDSCMFESAAIIEYVQSRYFAD